MGKWRVPKTLLASLRGVGLSASSCSESAVHAAVRLPYFAPLDHSGMLNTVWHRHHREYMFRSRGVGLRDLLWSRASSLAEFVTPFPVSSNCLGGVGSKYDCGLAPWSKDSDAFLDSEVRCYGSVFSLRDILQRWQDQGDGCDVYLREKCHDLHFVCLQVPTPC